MRLFILFIIIGFFCVPCSLLAQEFERKKDSIDKETEKQYIKLQEKPSKDKLGRFLRRVLLRNPNSKGISSELEEAPSLKQVHGKIIRNIEIVTLDPFGYAVNDTAKKPKRWIEKAGNTAHIKSNRLAVRNYLLFKKNKVLDSTEVHESARLLRRQQFIRRVRIEAEPIHATSDSVDVKVRVLDSWSTFFVPSVSGAGYRGKLHERNFAGLGHSFTNKLDHRTEDGKTAYSGSYFIPNIYNTYISSNLRFSSDLYDNQYKKIAFNRSFYSTVTKWAGGIEVSELYFRDSIPDAQQNYSRQPVKYLQQRYWGGYSIPLVRNSQHEEASLRMTTSLGFEAKNFSEVPTAAFDSVGYYADDRHVLLKIALTSNRYVQDKYVFRYNEIEDIPVGEVYSITTGIRRKHQENQWYLGLRYSFGNYHRIGYFNADIQAGSYFDKGEMNQAVLNLRFSYFTPIIDVGSWRFRYFLTQSIVFGKHRNPVSMDMLSLLGEEGIKGFNETVYGNKKAILTLQAQSYAPWAWMGFRFNPFFNASLGVVAEENKTLFNSPLHSMIGLGVLIMNDYFVIDRFQFSISYYPHIPADGSHLFHINGFKNSDLRIPNFNSGRPEVVPYSHPRENEYP